MLNIDKFIARTLLVAPSVDKWTAYQNRFRDFFAERWPRFDELISFLTDYCGRVGAFPTRTAYETELTAANNQELLEYIRDIDDATLPIYAGYPDFVSVLQAGKIYQFRADLLSAVAGFDAAAKGSRTDLDALQQALNGLQSHLYTAQQRALGSDAADTSFLYGKEAQQELREHYQRSRPSLKGRALLHLPFRQLADVQIKQGDLIFVGAYTSQGKSILLRALAYHFLYEYGLNVAFMSLEMSRDAIEDVQLLHANNKRTLSGYAHYPSGALTRRAR